MLTKGLKLTAMYAFDVYNEIHVHQDRAESTYYFLDTNVPYDLTDSRFCKESIRAPMS